MPWKVIGGIFGGLIIILLIILLFSGNDPEQVENVVEVVSDEQDITVEVIEASASSADALLYEQIELLAVDGSGSSGVARRGYTAGLFTHVVIASLPSIDTEQYFYEGWLVKPGIVDFFSTGEMFPREDGKWGLVWEVDSLNAPDDLDDYSQVVITLEPRDDDPAPAAHHVIEGEF
jgi:hypothetical protein